MPAKIHDDEDNLSVVSGVNGTGVWINFQISRIGKLLYFALTLLL